MAVANILGVSFYIFIIMGSKFGGGLFVEHAVGSFTCSRICFSTQYMFAILTFPTQLRRSFVVSVVAEMSGR